MRTRVKICGVTRPEDALSAVAAGCDAVGLVFYAPSPRAVTAAQARDIVSCLPPFVASVGLFVNAAAAEVEAITGTVPLAMLQFHGDEPGADCRRYGIPYLKAVRVRDDLDWAGLERDFSDAAALLLDTYDATLPGGTGRTFDWNRIPAMPSKPIVLAGGLTAENVAEAIHRVKPYAVDVSGGVEMQKGIKDPEKIKNFIDRVRRCDEQQ